ncbi:MAG: cyclase family protein [Coriobacteriales bacterium]|nr:cyclase family protein [Coriobacteriales bacterium]
MSLWGDLEKLKSCTWVDLTHPLNNESPYWGGMPEGVVDLCHTVFDYDSPILKCRIHTYKFPGQFGTHVDFPLHFEPGLAASEAYDDPCVLPLVVIDITPQMKANIEHAITVDDILAFEAANGKIPAGSFVALRTDWHKRWPDNNALNNFDADGGEHCPGWSLEALKFLYEERGIAMNGHETFDTDASSVAAALEDLGCERYVLANGHLQLEAMATLDKLPATGAIIFVAWPHIEGATGLPVRAWAVFD